MKKIAIPAAMLCLAGCLRAQAVRDSAEIQEVVVTGQFSPQSIKKSLYKVDVVSAADIARMGANNVAEALSQMHSLIIVPERSSGDSKANILGLSSDYTKIIIDNIPVIGDTGLGSNIDLTKISLDNIERIELVKGSMGVEFGNSAVAGVINIITKKSSKKKWAVSGFVQEETVGKEYDWVDYGKGRHIQGLNLGHSFGDGKWYANVSFNRNDFQGYRGKSQGKNYFERDNLRGYEWQPKEQWNPSFLIRYFTPKTQIFYSGDYLLEEINYYNPLVEPRYFGGGEHTYISRDRDYFTDRMLHHLSAATQISAKLKYAGDFSYQKQTRKFRDIIFDIPARKRLSEDEKATYYNAETYYMRHTLNIAATPGIQLLAGHEGDFTKGFSGMLTGKFDNKNVEKNVMSNAAFVSAEIPLADRWFVRPGFRYTFSNRFKNTPSYSLVLKNSINDHSEFRAIIGTANRNPNFEELFTYFVDSNHDVRGNENLRPENSCSGTVYYSYFNKPGADLKFNIDLSTMYLQLKDRIDMVDSGSLKYRYENVGQYQSWENAVSAKLYRDNFGAGASYSLLGTLPQVNGKWLDGWRYTNEFSLNLWYTIGKTGTTFSTNLKARGKNYSFFEDKSLGITQFIYGERAGFTLLDASVSQKFWQGHFTLVAGVRNIFNVSDVRNLSAATGAHGSTANEMLFYGRSWFGKLNFNF